MCSDNIFTNDDQIHKNIRKKSYSNNYLLIHQKCSPLSTKYDSTHSLPILSEKKTLFAQFIADEKYNLQFFRSFKTARKITDKQKGKKKIIQNFHLLPFNIRNNYCSPLTNSKIFDDEKVSPTRVNHSSNFAPNTSASLNTISRKKIYRRFYNCILSVGIVGTDRDRYLHHVKHEKNHMNNEQTKAVLCFILQLNTYFNEKLLTLQKKSNKSNEYYVHSKKLNVLQEKIIGLNLNTTSTLDFLSKSNLNDAHLAETNDSIDISMQLSDNIDCSSKLILNENDDLLTFYNPPKINNIFEKATNNILSNDLLSNDETNISNIIYSSLKKKENQQASIISINDRQESIKIKDLISNRNELNIHQQSMFDSSLISYNYHISESSIDLRNLLSESTENESSLPLHSRCLVSFEFVDREKHLVEVVELPRPFQRVSRMSVYKKIHQRLTLMNLIDIDLTALLRTILQSFS